MTMTTYPLRCQCGTVRAVLAHPARGNRVVCYCHDCQAFAHVLDQASRVLDERGGSEIIQVLPKNLTFTQGTEALACLRLTPKGLLRWHSACCRTPIGNTLATGKMSFIGLIHSCLDADGGSRDVAFGPIRSWVHTRGAQGEPQPKEVGLGTSVGWFLRTTLRARFNGDYKLTPFFKADTGAPIAVPRVLSAEEHVKVMTIVRGAP
jgi:hypothetical protein